MPFKGQELVARDIFIVAKTYWGNKGNKEKLTITGRFGTFEAALEHAKKGVEWEADEFLIIQAKEVYYDYPKYGSVPDELGLGGIPETIEDCESKGELPLPPVVS